MRREEAEKQAGAIGGRRSELEAELAKSKQAHEQLRRELEEAGKRLQAQHEASTAERAALEARIEELGAVKVEAEKQLHGLTESLANEAKRREEAEKQAGALGGRRGELEAELAKSKQAHEQLRREIGRAHV